MKRMSVTLVWILTAASLGSAQTTFYFPHITNGVLGVNIWKTTIFLTNPGAASSAATGTITFTQDNSNKSAAGSPFNISFIDEAGQTSSGTISFSIAGAQTKKYVSSGTGRYAGGFATVATDAGIVNGTAVFSQYDPSNRLIAEAGVPQANAVTRQSIFVDTIGDYKIGVAYANPGTSAAPVTLSLLNANGMTVMPTTLTLGPGNHSASFTYEAFPTIPQLTGSLQVTSSMPLAAIALRFDPNFAIFTTLPPVTLTSMINPAIEWLQRRSWLAPLTSVARLLSPFQRRIG